MENRFKSDIERERFAADTAEMWDGIKSCGLVAVLFIIVVLLANIFA